MFRLNLKIALRNLWENKGFALISIAGLGLDALSSLGLGETIAPLMGTLTLAPQ